MCCQHNDIAFCAGCDAATTAPRRRRSGTAAGEACTDPATAATGAVGAGIGAAGAGTGAAGSGTGAAGATGP